MEMKWYGWLGIELAMLYVCIGVYAIDPLACWKAWQLDINNNNARWWPIVPKMWIGLHGVLLLLSIPFVLIYKALN